MKIEIFGAAPGVDISKIFDEMCELNNIKNVLIFPEFDKNRRHPQQILDYVRKYVSKCIKENKDIFVLTYSDHVLNGFRLAIKDNSFSGGICHQYKSQKDFFSAKIFEDGRLQYWEANVFDTWDTALFELL